MHVVLTPDSRTIHTSIYPSIQEMSHSKDKVSQNTAIILVCRIWTPLYFPECRALQFIMITIEINAENNYLNAKTKTSVLATKIPRHVYIGVMA